MKYDFVLSQYSNRNYHYNKFNSINVELNSEIRIIIRHANFCIHIPYRRHTKLKIVLNYKTNSITTQMIFFCYYFARPFLLQVYYTLYTNKNASFFKKKKKSQQKKLSRAAKLIIINK